MVIFSFWLVERVGRKKGLVWGAFVGSIPMWYIGGYVMKADPQTAAEAGELNRNGWGYLAMGEFQLCPQGLRDAYRWVVCVYLYGLIYCATWQGITWVYCSEIFPLGTSRSLLSESPLANTAG